MRVPAAPLPHQHLVLSMFFILVVSLSFALIRNYLVDFFGYGFNNCLQPTTWSAVKILSVLLTGPFVHRVGKRKPGSPEVCNKYRTEE